MKRLLLSSAGLGLTLSAFAQLPVSTAPQNRKVLLEEFTGIHCVWCPDGHKMANELKASKPAGSVIIANIHTGGYATPGAGEPDFRTAEGDAISNIPGTAIAGYPTGSINRHKFNGQPGFALNRGDWGRYTDSTLAKPSYVNVALAGTLNIATRVLTVNVQAYYTANSPVPTNKLTVMLLEDGIVGPQTGGSANYPAMVNPDGTYNHNHMLRKVLTTAATGEVISTTTSGTTVSKTYTYTVPAMYVNNAANLVNLHIIAFMAESDSEVITAAEGPLTVTGTDSKITISSPIAGDMFCTATTLPNKVVLKNTGSVALTSAEIYYKAGTGTYQVYNWTGSLAAGATTDVTLGNVTISGNTTIVDSVGKLNGAAENNPVNSVAKVGLAGQSAPAALPIATSFEGGTPSTWISLDANGKVVSNPQLRGSTWSSITDAGIKAYDGSWLTCYFNSDNDPGATAILILPYANMAAGAKALDFYYGYAKRGTVGGDKLEVVTSTDCGATWQSAWSREGDALANQPPTAANALFVPSQVNQYKLASVDLSSATGNTLVGLRSTSNGGSTIWIDKVNLRTGAATGIEELVNSSSLSLYPNPVNEKLNIEMNMVKAASVSFTIVNIVGQQVGQPTVKNFSQGTAKATIATDNLTPGIYFLNITTDKGSVQQKFVKD